jgi:competence protein ComEA
MKAFLSGLGIGMGLGVLFAPDNGEATRKKVWDGLRKWSESMSRQAEGIKAATESARERISGAATNGSANVADLPPKKDVKGEAAPSAIHELINTVGHEELMSVNGIGPVLADRIISSRPYSSPSELLERGILPQSTFDELERELSRREKRSA